VNRIQSFKIQVHEHKHHNEDNKESTEQAKVLRVGLAEGVNEEPERILKIDKKYQKAIEITILELKA
jgi:hypothetical protein